ncbi:MAG: phospho-sugar mutase [Polyangiales bacterium]
MSVRLSFGTAGIRAKVGPGDDRLNEETLSAVIGALCAYLRERDPSAADAVARAGVCIGFDGRADSAVFASIAVGVVRVHGLRSRAFAQPVPTPLLAYATRLHGAAAGIMVTASHNPADDNGIKIYLAGGAQLGAPHDAEITRRMIAYDPATVVGRPVGAPVEALGEAEIEHYLDALIALVPGAVAPPPPFAYTALAGVGGALTRRLVQRLGARDVLEVAEEAEPRSDFAGIREPNPEHAAARARLCALMDAHGLGLGFAHDPDADRLAVVVRARSGALHALSGDEVGALLGAFLLAEATEPTRCLLVSTLVSGGLLASIARAHGARYERTPTGFKHIAARGRALEAAEGLRFVLGYEEAIGYAFGSLADDKDGLAALRVLLALAARLAAEGRTLVDALDALFVAHGVVATRQITVAREAAGPDLLARLRQVDPASLLGPGAHRVDHEAEPERLPLVVLHGARGDKLCARPSGTEPKLKLYLEAHADVAEPARLDDAKRIAARALDALEAGVRALISA